MVLMEARRRQAEKLQQQHKARKRFLENLDEG